MVDEPTYDGSTEFVVETACEQTVGDGFYEATDIGIVITQDHERQGALLRRDQYRGGNNLLFAVWDVAVEGSEEGDFHVPTAVGDVDSGMAVVREEMFSQGVSLLPIGGAEEAIDLLNRGEFGNAAVRSSPRAPMPAASGTTPIRAIPALTRGTATPVAFLYLDGTKDSFFGDLHARARTIQFCIDKTIDIKHWPDT